MPFSFAPRLGFIGAGRLTRCLALGFSRAGYPVTSVSSRSPASAHALAEALDGCRAVDDPQQVVDTADIVFLAVPDDSIGTVANTLHFDAAARGGRRQALVHCSGATEVAILSAAAAQGAFTGGFHPLYLFGGTAADVERIAGCSIAVEAAPELGEALKALARAIGCHPLSIAPGERMLYHGAAHYAASFALSALAEAVALWRALGMDETDTLRALLPMLAGSIETAREKGLAGALAGPVSRGDAGLLEKQLARFEALGGDHAALYALLTRRAIALARSREAPPATLEAMAAAVEATLARALPAARTFEVQASSKP
ncbi:DUF2520 domain-containing protein [Trinickia caryophylli]|uniref:Predicted oxidoreductase, contains short-chain dehydrogenase (SDR) and DUF2520 domains n=1 Tax=Trinickia caryophylli TaxID=28094 RepID=A0A1X7CJI6_TRICW|nr:DUF2520 domain-containing protein [Trinickia caryophylli]PMS11488.1 DUF2520 domain-containing protein [Trinickia caryophylli]TRX19961.1 DUF2520 domain-containing protein [Trinickia caryophylli]WQE12701.1 DUF2520 domain-containing protein [Trinickia caryophylli]SME97669.1 Predicted oxidoreductase, contains short-chain dehydrogenase (SDR) and DUF2520 domains [Trinickia caryophylli]GLU30408.1 hypothetical protein Busp01_02500 [Trinickia caryophylli]